MVLPLSVEELSVHYRGRDGREIPAVSKVSWELRPGRVLGVAGESGSGKSTAMLAAMGYRTANVRVSAAGVWLGEIDLLAASPKRLRELWGSEISYVSQNAALALNPTLTVGTQLGEVLRAHTTLARSELEVRKRELFADVEIPDAASALQAYPHQFSGGQQQRIALAIAVAAEPKVLLLDEPTTGLDVTTQARITALLRRLVEERQMAVMYVSHDLGLLASVADELKIMCRGEIVESGPAQEVLAGPRHEYSKSLISAVPDITGRRRVRGEKSNAPGSAATPLLRAQGLTLGYGGKIAVHDVSLDVSPGEIVSIVGESGSGKSTIARAVAGVHGKGTGRVLLEGRQLQAGIRKRSRADQRAVQLIFQNPKTALNPRHSAIDMVQRAVQRFRPEIARQDRRTLAEETLSRVGLEPDQWNRRPDELSGGQCQRVALARGVVAEPKLLICDEVTSALDVSVQARILELLVELVEESGMGVLFITHDLRVVRSLADRVVVMQRGRLQESGSVDDLFTRPESDYTRTLLAAVPPLPTAKLTMEAK